MAKIVRIAVNAGIDKIDWPRRCPRCGTQEELTVVRCRVARVSVALPTTLGSYIPIKSETIHLSFPACKQHAFQNEIGIRILEKTPLMYLLRWLAYVAFIGILLTFVQISHGREAGLKFFFGISIVFRYFMLFGLLGVLLVIWAKKVSSVRPIRIDTDVDVVEIRFAAEEYAKDFRMANPLLTLKLLTDRPPFFMRPSIWKIFCVVVLLAFICYMTSQVS